MVNRDQVFEAIQSMKGRATLSDIYAWFAKKWGRQQLTATEKHNIRSAVFSLKTSGRIERMSPSTYRASK